MNPGKENVDLNKSPAKKSVDVSKGGKRIICLTIGILIIAILIGLHLEQNPGQDSQGFQYSKDEYVVLCERVDYKELFRYSEKYEGKNIKFIGEVSQVMKESGYTVYKLTTGNAYGIYSGDDICVFDDSPESEIRILEGDVIEIYGIYDGLTTWEYAISKTEVEVPTIYAKFIELKN